MLKLSEMDIKMGGLWKSQTQLEWASFLARLIQEVEARAHMMLNISLTTGQNFYIIPWNILIQAYQTLKT